MPISTAEHAKIAGQPYFMNFDYVCPTCGTGNPKFVTSTNSCSICFYNDEVKKLEGMEIPYSQTEALNSNTDVYFPGALRLCKRGPHLLIHTVTHNRCAACANDRSPRTKAQRSGADHYRPTGKCLECGKRALRRTASDECTGCAPPATRTPSAREAARVAGATTYQPTTRCNRGHLSARYVSTGNCIECMYPHRNKPPSLSARDAAIAAGATTYTTGEPCKRGHLAPRYVSTSNCTACRPSMAPAVAVAYSMPRELAAQLGFVWYESGIPCRHPSHTTIRKVTDNSCVKCHRVPS